MIILNKKPKNSIHKKYIFKSFFQKFINKKRIIIFNIFTTLIITSCSNTPVINPYEGKSPDYILYNAKKYLVDGKYYESRLAFNSLNSQYPFTKYSEESLVNLIYIYYDDNNAEMSLATVKQFLKLYPTSKYLPYIYYMRGVLLSNSGRGFLQRYLPYDMSKHDPRPFQEAIYSFDKSINLDKNSKFFKDAEKRIVYLNQTIAQYNLNIANFYYERQAYIAAINRANIIITRYPQTIQLEESLVLIAKSYQILNLQEMFIESLKNIQLNFPQNKFLLSVKDSMNANNVTSTKLNI